jgi:hypothetical protein
MAEAKEFPPQQVRVIVREVAALLKERKETVSVAETVRLDYSPFLPTASSSVFTSWVLLICVCMVNGNLPTHLSWKSGRAFGSLSHRCQLIC